MTTESKSETICLGTRLVVLLEPRQKQQVDDTSLVVREFAAEGLLVVYEQRSTPAPPTSSTTSSTTVEAYRIEVGTNHGVYHGTIDLSQVKLTNGDKTDLAKYLLQDGKDHPDITIQFQHVLDTNNNNTNKEEDSTLQLIIKERLEKLGLQKFVFTGSLSSSRPDGLTSRKIKPSLLQFCHGLGNVMNDSVQTIQGLQNQLQEKDQSLGYWKQTAQQLEKEVWQKEKDRLVHNFLKLWKERQDRAKKQLDDLQAELDATKAALQAKTNEKRKGRSLKLDDAIANAAEDDLTGQPEPIPLEQVEAFATGQKPTTQSAPTILKQEDTVSMSTLLQQADEYAKRKRPTRKAAAKQTLKDADDDSETDEDIEPPTKRKAPRRTKADSQKPTTTRAAKAPKRTTRKTSSKRSDSAADGRESPILALDSDDEALRAQIRAGIQNKSPHQQEKDNTASSRASNKRSSTDLDDKHASNEGKDSPLLSLNSDDEALRAQIRAGIARKPPPTKTMDKEEEENSKAFNKQDQQRKRSLNLSLDDDDATDTAADDGKESPLILHDSEDEAIRSRIRAGIERRLTLSSSDED